MKPLSTYYDHNIRKWLRTNPGCVVTQFQMAALFGSAYLEAATMTNVINGFQKAGIWPVNRNVFSKAETTVINFSETLDTCDMTVTSHLCASASHPSVITSHPLTTNTQIFI